MTVSVQGSGRVPIPLSEVKSYPLRRPSVMSPLPIFLSFLTLVKIFLQQCPDTVQ